MRSFARVLLVLVLLNGIVITHELGHFFTARLLDIPVARISLGFGPAITQWQADDYEIRISAIWLGGYVELSKEGSKELASRPPWQSVVLTGAGIFVNWVLPIPVLLLFSRRYRAWGKERLDFPDTVLRRDIRVGRWIRIPLIGMFIYMLKALAAPLGDSVVEEVAWKFSDFSRLIGYFNLIPIFFFDGGQVLYGLVRMSGLPQTALVIIGVTFIWFIAWLEIPKRFPRYYRWLL